MSIEIEDIPTMMCDLQETSKMPHTARWWIGTSTPTTVDYRLETTKIARRIFFESMYPWNAMHLFSSSYNDMAAVLYI